jgi:hypothetical protein
MNPAHPEYDLNNGASVRADAGGCSQNTPDNSAARCRWVGLNQNDHLWYTAPMSTDTEIRNQVARRNSIRGEAKLPRLDGHREFEKLKAARKERIFESVFAMERARFSRNWTSSKSWFSGLSEYNKARTQVRLELRTGQHMDSVLRHLGYRLVEDSWAVEGRKTYVSDENADREFLTDLERTLAEYGWDKHETRLCCFSNPHTSELIGIEPGGADTSDHFLHHLKSG